jgi:uridine phosphorylase
MKPSGTSSGKKAGGVSGSSRVELFAEDSCGLPVDQDALIQPTREPGEEPVTPTVILTFTQPDYQSLCRMAQAGEAQRQVWGCACRTGSWEGTALTVAAPAMGAPYAAMVLEKLIALGARRVLVLGWCGSLSPEVRIGEMILPSCALPGDGTSPHYCPEPGAIPPHPGLYDILAASLKSSEVRWQTGPVWSTDAFYRETQRLVKSCQEQGALGIDLELAALFAVGRLRGIAVAGLLVVSDELFGLTWQPARGSQPFRRARRAALRLVLEAAAQAEGRHV